MVEFCNYDDISINLGEFRIKKDVLIASILRNGQLIIPDGTTSIKEGDCVIIAAAKHCRIRNLNEIIK